MLARLTAAVVAALAFVGAAEAKGGNYEIVGATPTQQATIRDALEVSEFNWSVVPARITIRVSPDLANQAESVRGEIRIQSSFLDWGISAWASIQHEYAHQVDYYLLDNGRRDEALRVLGLPFPWRDLSRPHDERGVEHFATMLSVAYWPSVLNLLRPTVHAKHDVRTFQMMIARWGLAAPPAPVCQRVKVKRGFWHRHVDRRHWHKPVFKTTCQ